MTPVTVLLPVRNGAAFLDAALRSMLAQDGVEFEVLVIEDGSTDQTPSILARHANADRRIRVLATPRPGLVAALNHGMAMARHPFVARMDADDLAAPERLRLQAAALDRDDGLALVASGWRVIDAAGQVRRILHPPADPHALRAELDRRNCLAHASVMLRRAAVLALGGYRPAFRLAEDYDLWLRLGERHGMLALPEVLLDHREHAGQSSLAGLEQRILSELGLHAAVARRRHGEADGMDGEAPVSRADLVRLGMDAAALRDGILSRALGAAEDAVRAGHRAAARAAVALAWRQGALALRTRLHLATLAVRAAPAGPFSRAGPSSRDGAGPSTRQYRDRRH